MTKRESLTSLEWLNLLGGICDGKCAPFLGAGACEGTLPLGSEIARQWADEHEFPFEERHDLARVAQFLAVIGGGGSVPKRLIRDWFESLPSPDFDGFDEPHAALARLPLPLYITTNYDGFMYEALCRAGKEPRRELCRWQRGDAYDAVPAVLDGTFVPEPETPVVFHLHGHLDIPSSLVLTEDDYLDFLVAVSRDEHMLLPHEIRRAAATSLLFVGYSLADWDFRVILRGILSRLQKSEKGLNVTVQLPRDDPQQEKYLEQYFRDLFEVKVFWGTARDFARELREHWEEFEPKCKARAAARRV
jgi:SIR2-like domain